jgi:hypothetical protein
VSGYGGHFVGDPHWSLSSTQAGVLSVDSVRFDLNLTANAMPAVALSLHFQPSPTEMVTIQWGSGRTDTQARKYWLQEFSYWHAGLLRNWRAGGGSLYAYQAYNRSITEVQGSYTLAHTEATSLVLEHTPQP